MKRKPTAGSYSLILQAKPVSRWKTEGEPEFDPNWVVRFRLPNEKPRTESSGVPICEGCLSAKRRQIVSGEAPERSGCGSRPACTRMVTEWADVRLGVLTALWQRGRIEEMQQLLRPAQVVSIGKMADTYLASAPEGMKATFDDNVRDLYAVVMQTLGVTKERAREQPVTALTMELAVQWMTLRWHSNQERNLPEKKRRTLDELRAAYAAGTLAAPPRNVASPGNSTIRSMLTKVRSIFGDTSRTHYLRGLDIPELSFSKAKALLSGKGQHTPISGEVFAELEREATAALQRGERDYYVAHMLASRFGFRPVEIRAARKSWLMKDGEGWVLDVRNRPEDGFMQKPRARAVTGRYTVPADVAAVLNEGDDGGLLFAPKASDDAREKLLGREYSQRLRKWLPKEQSKDTWYALRKLYLSAIYTDHGKEAASAAARHASSDVVEAHYAKRMGTVPAVSLERLAAG